MKKKARIFSVVAALLAMLMCISFAMPMAVASEAEGELPEFNDTLPEEYFDGPITTPADPDKLGDVNGDGAVNIKDATAIQKHIVRMAKIADEDIAKADIDGDTYITAADVTLLQKQIIHLA